MHSGLLFFCTSAADCRKSLSGDVKGNEYRSEVSELRFKLQRKAPAAWRPYRKNAAREWLKVKKNVRASAIMQNDLSTDRGYVSHLAVDARHNNRH